MHDVSVEFGGALVDHATTPPARTEPFGRAAAAQPEEVEEVRRAHVGPLARVAGAEPPEVAEGLEPGTVLADAAAADLERHPVRDSDLREEEVVREGAALERALHA